MKRITKGLPQPLTLKDSAFMQNMLAAIRLKREQATKGVKRG